MRIENLILGDVNVFMLSYYDPKFIEKYLWECFAQKSEGILKSKFDFSNVNVIMLSYYDLKFIKSVFSSSSIFQIFTKFEMTRAKDRLCGRHFETVFFSLFFFYLNMVVFNVSICSVVLITKFHWFS